MLGPVQMPKRHVIVRIERGSIHVVRTAHARDLGIARSRLHARCRDELMGDEDVEDSIIELVAGKSLTHRVVMRDDFLSCIRHCHAYVGWTHEGKQVNANTLAVSFDRETIDAASNALAICNPEEPSKPEQNESCWGES